MLDAHLSRGADAQLLWLAEVVEAAQRSTAVFNGQRFAFASRMDAELIVPPLSMRAGLLSSTPIDTLDALYGAHLHELHGRGSTLTTPTQAERVAAVLMLVGLGIPQVDHEYERAVAIAEAYRLGSLDAAGDRARTRTQDVDHPYISRACFAFREPSNRRIPLEEYTSQVTVSITGFPAVPYTMKIPKLDPLAYIAQRIETWQNRMEMVLDYDWEVLGIYTLPPHMFLDPAGSVRQSAYREHVRELRPQTGNDLVAATTPECMEAARFLLRCFCTDVPEYLIASTDFDDLHLGVEKYMRLSTSSDAVQSMTPRGALDLMAAVALRLRARPA